MRRPGYKKEVDRLQKRGGPAEKRWTGYKKEVDRLQKRCGKVTEKRWTLILTTWLCKPFDGCLLKF
jgi:hypothetical protein